MCQKLAINIIPFLSKINLATLWRIVFSQLIIDGGDLVNRRQHKSFLFKCWDITHDVCHSRAILPNTV